MSYSNSPPLFGTFPGWTQGTDLTGIQITLVYDLLCIDSLNANSVINDLLTMTFNNSTVEEQVIFGYTMMPLPYHIHSF